jgi:hypothetical protein
MIAAADAANRVCAVTLRPRRLECFASRLTTNAIRPDEELAPAVRISTTPGFPAIKASTAGLSSHSLWGARFVEDPVNHLIGYMTMILVIAGERIDAAGN